MRRGLPWLIVGAVVLCLTGGEVPAVQKAGKKRALTVTSPVFKNGGTIPRKHTGDGADVSPPIEWSRVPANTRSIALIADDPDAPGGTWTHWVLFNWPADTRKLPENTPREGVLKNGARQGTNDFGSIGYRGPMPPSGTHRYFFKVYALDKPLDLRAGITKPDLLRAMEGHILAQGQLMGKYARK
jgi:hypothetical protein